MDFLNTFIIDTLLDKENSLALDANGFPVFKQTGVLCVGGRVKQKFKRVDKSWITTAF